MRQNICRAFLLSLLIISTIYSALAACEEAGDSIRVLSSELTPVEEQIDTVGRRAKIDSLPLLPRLQNNGSRFIKQKVDLDAVANF